MVIHKHESFKYYDCLYTVCQKMKKDSVRMNHVNVIVTKDQFLEEEMGSDSIARKTI